MKKAKEVGLFALLLMMGLWGLQACLKDHANMEQMPGFQAIQAASMDAAAEQRILEFKKKCKFYRENPMLKTTELLGVEDAIWLMESSLNYTYGFPDKAYENVRLDSSAVQLQCLPGDSISYTCAAACYYQLVDSLAKVYSANYSQDKRVVMAQIKKVNSNNAGSVNLRVYTMTGKERQVPANPLSPFTSSDYWYYGYSQGKCGAFTGQGFGSDAAREMENLQSLLKPLPPVGCHVFYTNIESVDVYAHEYPNPANSTPCNNMFAYLMFCNDDQYPSTYHECVEPVEMNFHFNGLRSVIFDMDKARSHLTHPGKGFVSLLLCGVNVTIGGSSPHTYAEHKASIRYGTVYLSNDMTLPVNPVHLF